MTNPIATWHAEHVYFGRLLDLLQREVDTFHTGCRPGYVLMLDIISYLRDYSDQFHHPREDVAFAHLAEHRHDLRLELARLSQEHRVIARAGEKLAGLLEAILGDVVVPRGDVEAAAATYLVYYRNHIAREEAGVLAIAAESLTPAEWEAVMAAVPAGPVPVADAQRRYQALRHQIALEA